MTALVEQRGLVEVRGLEKRFAMPTHFLSREKPVLHALNGVDAVVRQGEAFCVVGESGCGKTTLGRIVMGLTEPSNGEVHFDGTRIATVCYQDTEGSIITGARTGRGVDRAARCYDDPHSFQ